MSLKSFIGVVLVCVIFFASGYSLGSSNNIIIWPHDDNATIAALLDEIDTLEKTVESLEKQLDEGNPRVLTNDYSDYIDGIIVNQHYEWDYGTEWSWDLSIPLSLYLDYYSKPRPADIEGYVELALDPGDDVLIEGIVDSLEDSALDYGFNYYETVMYVISFVQSMPYTEDSVTARWDEYPRYPVETLFDRGGDCEDTSILVCALLDEMGYDTCLVVLESEQHCAVGVAGGEGIYGAYYSVDDVNYFFLETTGEGWEIGDIPQSYDGVSAQIFPLNDYR